MNTARDVVMRLLDDSGLLLFRAGEGLTDDEFFEEPEFGASYAWTLGHLSAFQDWALSNIEEAEERMLDSETREFFRGGRSVAEFSTPRYPSRQETLGLFRTTQARAIGVLRAFDVDRWGDTTPTGCRYPTLGAVWESMAYENYWHLGQLSVSVPRFRGTSMTVPVPRPYKLPYAP